MEPGDRAIPRGVRTSAPIPRQDAAETAVPTAKTSAAREAADVASAHAAMESTTATMEASTAAIPEGHGIGRHGSAERKSGDDRDQFRLHGSLSFALSDRRLLSNTKLEC